MTFLIGMPTPNRRRHSQLPSCHANSVAALVESGFDPARPRGINPTRSIREGASGPCTPRFQQAAAAGNSLGSSPGDVARCKLQRSRLPPVSDVMQDLIAVSPRPTYLHFFALNTPYKHPRPESSKTPCIMVLSARLGLSRSHPSTRQQLLSSCPRNPDSPFFRISKANGMPVDTAGMTDG